MGHGATGSNMDRAAAVSKKPYPVKVRTDRRFRELAGACAPDMVEHGRDEQLLRLWNMQNSRCSSKCPTQRQRVELPEEEARRNRGKPAGSLRVLLQEGASDMPGRS